MSRKVALIISFIAFLVTCSRGTGENYEIFFKDLFENTSAGYVFFGEKPLYLGSFYRPIYLMPGSEKHREAIYSYLSLLELASDSSDSSQSNYLFVFNILKNTDSPHIEFMFINKKEFLKVIEQNLILFKYKLGHDTTPEKVLLTLCSSNESFSSVFGNEIALQGILLGYGAENAISFERASQFTNIFEDNTPISPPNQLPPPPATEAELINRIEKSTKGKHLWKKVKEETQDFTYYYSDSPNDSLKIPFSFHENSNETHALLESYKNAEEKVSEELSNNTHLEHVLKKLEVTPNTHAYLLSPNEKESISKALGHALKISFFDQVSTEFFEGIDFAQTHDFSSVENHDNFSFLEQLREQSFSTQNTRKNYQEALAFFEQFNISSDITCLIPNRLYYKTTKKRRFGKINDLSHSKIQVNFIIKDINNCPIDGSLFSLGPSFLDTQNLIPGLAHAIVGMHIGEKREVYVHPELAYGIFSKFGQGKVLKIEIEIVSIDPSSSPTILPSLKPIDVQHIAPKISTPSEYSSYRKNFSFYCGMKAWQHYKKGEKFIDLKTVIDEIKKDNPSTLSSHEESLLYKLDWYIYQNSG